MGPAGRTPTRAGAGLAISANAYSPSGDPQHSRRSGSQPVTVVHQPMRAAGPPPAAGGQPGHPGHRHPLVLPEQVDAHAHCYPEQCGNCQVSLSPAQCSEVGDAVIRQSHTPAGLWALWGEHARRAAPGGGALAVWSVPDGAGRGPRGHVATGAALWRVVRDARLGGQRAEADGGDRSTARRPDGGASVTVATCKARDAWRCGRSSARGMVAITTPMTSAASAACQSHCSSAAASFRLWVARMGTRCPPVTAACR
jgi:hypothetical protein